MENKTLIPLLMFAGFFALFAVVLRMAAIASRKALENVQHLAEQLRLKVLANNPKLGFYAMPEAAGMIRGKRVRIYGYTSGSGKSKTTWAALGVTVAAPSDLTFELTPQGFGTKLLQALGAKEIQVGDASFDRAWFVQTNAPEFLRAALLPEVQQKIRAGKGTWKLSGGTIVYAEAGSFADTARCERLLAAMDTACDLADIAEVYAKYSKS